MSGNCIQLSPKQPSGTVELPDCRLIIGYEHTGGRGISSDEQQDPEITLEAISTPLGVLRALVDILIQIPGMDKKEIRDTLLWGLTAEARDTVSPRHADDTRADLMSIVEGMKGLGELRTLIENARSRPKSSHLDTELDRVWQKWREYEVRNKAKRLMRVSPPHP
jgi:hypothetical protein